jgi:signal transduction histidine kinase
MQAQDTHGTNPTLAHVLQLIAAAPGKETALTATLEALYTYTNATGVSLARWGDIRFEFVVGDDAGWLQQMPDDRNWLASVPATLTRDTSLPGPVEAACWYTRRIPDDILVCVWFDEDTVLSEAAVTPLLNLVTITAAAYLANRRQERANQLANSVIDSILDPLLVLTDERTVLMMNSAAETLFDVETEAVIGMSLGDVVQSDELLELIDAPPPRVNTRPSEWTAGPDGAFTFLPSLSMVRTHDGVPDGWVLALRDVSRFKRLNLNQREFMRIVSHDLRSPMTAMQGFADMIRMGMVGEVTEKQIYFIDKILSGINQMTNIVDNIQDAGRFDPETGFYEMQRSHVDLGEMAAKIVEQQIIPAEKEDLTVELDVASDVPVINADENMIIRALTNLVDNAIKYTPDGGTVQVRVHKQDDWIVFSVTDDGNGISEEEQARLFQRHVRLARKEYARIKGTGLGLFIVRSVAQAHDGEALVESTPGEGATFSITIPLAGENLIGS